jgi:predicted dehydrogenase
MTHSNLKIGVLGLGSIGLRHATNLIALGHNVIGFDPSMDRQNLLIEKGGQVADKKDVLSECDAVVIATPNQYHHTDMQACIDAGCHVFVEKPVSHKTDGLNDIDIEAKKKNLVISVGMNIRLNPAIQYLKDMINTHKIGSILWGEYTFHAYLPDWRPGVDYTKGYAADPKTGGVIYDTVHGFDVLYHLLGAYDIRGCVAQQSGVIDISSDDIADIMCVHDNGVTSRLHMDYITKPKEHSVRLATDKGFVDVDISNRQYTWTSQDGEIKDSQDFSNTSVNEDYTQELNLFLKAAFERYANHCPLSEAIAVTHQVIKAREIAGLPNDI